MIFTQGAVICLCVWGRKVSKGPLCRKLHFSTVLLLPLDVVPNNEDEGLTAVVSTRITVGYEAGFNSTIA